METHMKSFDEEVMDKGNERHYNSHLREDPYTLEPDMIDQFGNRYYRYEEFMEATDGITDFEVIAHDEQISTV